MNVLGRLRDGETIQQAEAGVTPLWHALRANEPKALGHRPQTFIDDFLTRSRLVIEPGARGLSDSRTTLETSPLAVMAMAVLVMLLAAVNIAACCWCAGSSCAGVCRALCDGRTLRRIRSSC